MWVPHGRVVNGLRAIYWYSLHSLFVSVLIHWTTFGGGKYNLRSRGQPSKVLIAWLRTGCTPTKVSSMLEKFHGGSASLAQDSNPAASVCEGCKIGYVRMPVCHECGRSTRRESMPLDRNHAQPVFLNILIIPKTL